MPSHTTLGLYAVAAIYRARKLYEAQKRMAKTKQKPIKIFIQWEVALCRRKNVRADTNPSECLTRTDIDVCVLCTRTRLTIDTNIVFFSFFGLFFSYLAVVRRRRRCRNSLHIRRTERYIPTIQPSVYTTIYLLGLFAQTCLRIWSLCTSWLYGEFLWTK